MQSETKYFLRRASEEAQRAISSDGPAVADAHEALSVRYSAKASACWRRRTRRQFIRAVRAKLNQPLSNWFAAPALLATGAAGPI